MGVHLRVKALRRPHGQVRVVCPHSLCPYLRGGRLVMGFHFHGNAQLRSQAQVCVWSRPVLCLSLVGDRSVVNLCHRFHAPPRSQVLSRLNLSRQSSKPRVRRSKAKLHMPDVSGLSMAGKPSKPREPNNRQTAQRGQQAWEAWLCLRGMHGDYKTRSLK